MSTPLPGSVLYPPTGYREYVAMHGMSLNPHLSRIGSIGHVEGDTIESAFWLRTDSSISFYHRLSPLALRLKKVIAGEPCEPIYSRDIRFA